MSGAIDSSEQVCEHPNCDKPGKYRAPKSPDNIDDFHWFCLQHVREYNKGWNFFENQSEEDVAAQMDKDRVWGRSTQPFGRGDGSTHSHADGNSYARFGMNDPHSILGEQSPGSAATGRRPTRRLPPTERRALEILDAEDTMTKAEIRKLYKALVKDLHPDMNAGSRADEDRLTEVVWAWDQIKGSRSFAD